MANRRDHIKVWLEPEIAEAIRLLSVKQNVATSVLVRQLVVKELSTRGLLPELVLTE